MMAVKDKVVMEFGQHGKVCYIEAYVLCEYTDNGMMNPIAFTGDKEFALAFLDGKAEFPEDGVGVVNIMTLPTEDVKDEDL
jgi:hypothetical protein